jgi:predicted nucleotidyltransferase component of viral defense system
MLSPQELRRKSKEWGLPIESVDKDWVLGHVLKGLFDGQLREALVFKGGTCLRKVYFVDYRFSEDLDFSARRWVSLRELDMVLRETLPVIQERSGIRFGKFRIMEERFKDRLMGYQATVPFWGSAHLQNRRVPGEDRWRSRIRIDISLKEKIFLAIVLKDLIHPYSDAHELASVMPVYSLEEIFAEKWRALLQRSYLAPRDCYDLWYLWTRCRNEIQWESVRDTFLNKCMIKGIEVDSHTVFLSPERTHRAKAQWIPSLGDQLRNTPSVDEVLKEISEAFSKLLDL